MLQEMWDMAGKSDLEVDVEKAWEGGNPIPFANVLVVGTTHGATANVKGEYFIENITPGTYVLRVSAVGYKTKTAEVTVKPGETATANFILSIDVLRMGEVVVTGSFIPLSKMKSSLAISTLSPRELTFSNPRSTTEMLRYIPGFTRVESSGGEVNQNISIRGILGVEYVMFMEDGVPVYPTMHTFFINADNLFRPDENIERVEIIRGGSSSLFGSNTPEAIINFINKTGGPELSGTLKATAGTQGLARIDFNVNGPLGDKWRFNFGGFYRYDRGVRFPGYPRIRGGQLKASVTSLLDNRYVRASLKIIDDRNQFILPLPFQNPTDPKEVSHEESVGGQAIRENALEYKRLIEMGITEKLDDILKNIQQTRENYTMIDDDFQLPVPVAKYINRGDVDDKRKKNFLMRINKIGRSNLELILIKICPKGKTNRPH
jgi:hypothetical protein